MQTTTLTSLPSLAFDVEPCEYPDPRQAVPLYRAFSRGFNDHLYTTSNDWVDEHVRKHDHLREGVACYIFPTQEATTIPLYQLYKPPWTDHFYTTSLAEREHFLLHYGYLNEGIAGYVLPKSSASGGKPLYRLWSDARKDHMYTVSKEERSQALGRSYSCEGVVGCVYPASPV